MIAPHTIFLLQFARYRPEYTGKAVKPASVTTESAARKNPPEHRVPTLRRLPGMGESLPARG